MIQVFLADDERIARDSIKKNINWDSLGMNLCGEAADGLRAAQQVESLESLDIALLDICMPGMDGLDLAGIIKANFPDCLIVIITGHDEFEYARRSIKIGVSDYLLKPITKAELTEILSQLRDRVIALKEQNKENYDSNNSRMALLGSTYAELLAGNPIACDEEKLRKLFDFPSDGCFFTCAIMDADSFPQDSSFNEENASFHFALLNIAREILAGKGIAFSDMSGHATALISSQRQDAVWALQECIEYMNKISCTVSEFMQISISVGMGNPCESLFDAEKSFKEAVTALQHRFIKGPGLIHRYDQLPESMSNTDVDSQVRSLMRDIGSLSNESGEKQLEELFQLLRSITDVQHSRNLAVQAVFDLSKSIEEAGVSLQELGEEDDLVNKLFTSKLMDEIENWMISLYRRFREKLDERKSSPEFVAAKICDYLDTHYSDKKLSFPTLCSAVHFSQSYVSMILKREVGKTFVEYLTGVRIEKAKELLKHSECKTYEIAEKVGFSSPYYFSMVFKKTTELSPKEYRLQQSKLSKAENSESSIAMNQGTLDKSTKSPKDKNPKNGKEA